LPYKNKTARTDTHLPVCRSPTHKTLSPTSPTPGLPCWTLRRRSMPRITRLQSPLMH